MGEGVQNLIQALPVHNTDGLLVKVLSTVIAIDKGRTVGAVLLNNVHVVLGDFGVSILEVK